MTRGKSQKRKRARERQKEEKEREKKMHEDAVRIILIISRAVIKRDELEH